MTDSNRCPVCQARFRGAVVCSRCGADLTALMLLAVEAWRARDAARLAILAGDFARAVERAAAAQRAQATPAGDALLRVASALQGQT